MNKNNIRKMGNLLRPMLPKLLIIIMIKAYLLALRGTRFYCPVCEKSFRKFDPFGVIPRPNSCCPSCGSLERHRLLWATLRDLKDKGLIKQGGKLLHVAPETCLAEKIRNEYDYLSVDLDSEMAMMSVDITAMNFADETFDAVVCNHL